MRILVYRAEARLLAAIGPDSGHAAPASAPRTITCVACIAKRPASSASSAEGYTVLRLISSANRSVALQASAKIVSVGFFSEAVGNADPSTTNTFGTSCI